MGDTAWRRDTRTHDTVHFSDFSSDCGFEKREVAEISRVTWVGVAVNLLLAALKTAGGLLSGSRALLADAVHTVSDLATDCVILVGVRYWTAPADAEHPHGHRKIETLVTLAIGLALAAVGIGMGWEAVGNLARAIAGSQQEPRAAGMLELLALAAALISLVAKELLYRWTVAKGVKLGSSALVANAWHHRSDAFSSIPPLLTIGVNMVARRFGYDLWFLDPIGTVVVCVMLLQAAWEISGPTFAALVDASADRKVCSAIRKTVLRTPGVIDTHRIRTRCIGSGAVAVDLHVLVSATLSVVQGHSIASDVKYRILGLDIHETAMKAVDVMVHVEPAEADFPGPRSGNTKTDWMAGSNSASAKRRSRQRKKR